MESCSICPPVTGFNSFNIILSRFIHASYYKFPEFRSNKGQIIFFSICKPCFPLLIYLLMGIWIISTFELLCIALQKMWECWYLFRIISILLNKSPSVGLLNHVVILFLTFGNFILFSINIGSFSGSGVEKKDNKASQLFFPPNGHRLPTIK